MQRVKKKSKKMVVWLIIFSMMFSFVMPVNQAVVFAEATTMITTIAGTVGDGNTGDGSPASEAQINYPTDLAFDGAGNLYVLSQYAHKIRKIDASGNITTFAGTGTQGFSGDEGQASLAQLNYPTGIAVDAAGNVYIADGGNHRIRKVSTNGIISTIAGTGVNGDSGDGGPAINAEIRYPLGIALYNSNIFVSTSNNKIRRFTEGGTITNIAGTGTQGYSGDGGLATNAQLNSPWNMTTDSEGNLYVSDQANHVVRKIDTSGYISAIAGTGGNSGSSGDNAQATSAQLNTPAQLTIDSQGNLYIADQYNHKIRIVTTDGNINTFSGTGAAGFSGDGSSANLAMLNYPAGLTLDSNGNLYVADSVNNRVRKITITNTDPDPDPTPITHTITFDNNEGEGSAPNPIDVTEGSSWNLLPGVGDMSKAGLDFGGWTTEANNLATIVNDNEIPTSDLTLYAFWKAKPLASWSVEAATAVAGTDYNGGDGAYDIYTAKGLAWLANEVNTGAFSGYHAELAADIDLSGKQWVPIGNYDNPYGATFDGQGYKITGMEIGSSSVYNTTLQYAGLFGSASGGKIANLNLETAAIYMSNQYAVIGSLVANNRATVENCFAGGVIATYENNNMIGGLIGYNESGNVINSHAAVSITNHGVLAVVGGLVGQNDSDIQNSYSLSDLTNFGLTSDLGGFVGYMGDGSTAQNCYAVGNIISSEVSNVGGFAGYSYSLTQINDNDKFWNADTSQTVSGSEQDPKKGIGLIELENAGQTVNTVIKTATEMKAPDFILGLNAWVTANQSTPASLYSWSADTQNANQGFPILDYESLTPPTSTNLASDSLGVAGDTKITGLTSGNQYKVTVGGSTKYVKADGTLSNTEADVGNLTGTEITGLTNGTTYKVEAYTPTVPQSDYAITYNGTTYQVNDAGTFASLSLALAGCTDDGDDDVLTIKLGDADTPLTLKEVSKWATTNNGLITATYSGNIQIQDNTAETGNTIGLAIPNGVTATLKDLTITHTTADTNFSAVYMNGTCTLNIEDGCDITVKTANGYGIFNDGAGTINMSGGTISANATAPTGATNTGIYNDDAGTLNISGGTVSCNGTGEAYGVRNYKTLNISGTANVSGVKYGIHNSGASTSVSITGGTIEAIGAGGMGIYTSGGTLTMSDGLVRATENTATGATNGYGIYNSGTTTSISGGTVSCSGIGNNSAAIHQSNTTLLSISGTADISGVKYGIYVLSNKTSDLGALHINGGSVSASGVAGAGGNAILNQSSGLITIAAGSVNATGTNGIAVTNNSTGTLNMTGGTVEATNTGNTANYGLMNSYGGTANISGGTVSSAGTNAGAAAIQLWWLNGTASQVSLSGTAKAISASNNTIKLQKVETADKDVAVVFGKSIYGDTMADLIIKGTTVDGKNEINSTNYGSATITASSISGGKVFIAWTSDSTRAVPIGQVNGANLSALTTGSNSAVTTIFLKAGVLPTVVTLTEGSLGTASNGKITGLTAGSKYKVTVNSETKYVKADGTLSSTEADALNLTGTEITGLSNGISYKVEAYTPTTVYAQAFTENQVTVTRTESALIGLTLTGATTFDSFKFEFRLATEPAPTRADMMALDENNTFEGPDGMNTLNATLPKDTENLIPNTAYKLYIIAKSGANYQENLTVMDFTTKQSAPAFGEGKVTATDITDTSATINVDWQENDGELLVMILPGAYTDQFIHENTVIWSWEQGLEGTYVTTDGKLAATITTDAGGDSLVANTSYKAIILGFKDVVDHKGNSQASATIIPFTTLSEAPTTTISYDANSGTGDMTPQQISAGSPQNLTKNTFSREGYSFKNWNTSANGSGTSYADGAQFSASVTSFVNTVLYAQWIDNKNTFTVSGKVEDSSNPPLISADVKLMQGNAQIGVSVTTDANGNFTINNVSNGNYNLVVSKDDIVVTTLVSVNNANYIISGTIILPAGKMNSEVEVKPDTPEIVVGNLEKQFTDADKTSAAAGDLVEIRFAAEAQDETAENAEDITNAAAATGRTVGMFIDFSVLKKIGTSEPVAIGELPSLIVVLIPLDISLQGKKDYVIYRYHGSEVNMITTIANGDGEKIELIDDGKTIKLTAKKFSMYAVAYDESVPTPGPGPTPTPVPIKTYALTYNANGGTGTMKEQLFTESTKQALLKNTYERTGYSFAGWNTKQDGSGTAYTDMADFTATATATLYAQWTENTNSGFVGFLGETPEHHFYYYDQVDLNASYLYYQIYPESAQAKMYQHYVDNHVQMVALKDGIKGYRDYQTTATAYIWAQLKEEAFDLETYLASSAAKPYETNGRPVEIVDANGQVVN